MREIENEIFNWYNENKRDFPFRQTKNPYFIWISEIMSQQTQMSRVVDYYQRFIKSFPTIEDLANAEQEALLKAWEGLGYYSRVRNMQVAAQMVMEEFDGVFPTDYKDIIKLKGIGPYTGGAIASICFDEKVAAIDGNVLRVTTRYFEDGRDIAKQATKNQIKKEVEAFMPSKHTGEFNQALIELGATICTPTKPLCNECPLNSRCKAFAAETQAQFPVNNKKVKQVEENWDTFIIENQNGEIMMLEQEVQFLHGLFLLPQEKFEDDVNSSVASLEDKYHIKIDIETLNFIGNYKHIFSHKIWKMNVYYVRALESEDDSLFYRYMEKPVANAHRNFLMEINQ